jgi:hypothetical protein
MDPFADPNDVAVHAHHSEHIDLGTTTPELMILARVVKAVIRAVVKVVQTFIDYGWSICSWPNAPPVRAV